MMNVKLMLLAHSRHKIYRQKSILLCAHRSSLNCTDIAIRINRLVLVYLLIMVFNYRNLFSFIIKHTAETRLRLCILLCAKND